LSRRSQEKLRSYLPRFGFLVILFFVVFFVVVAVELVVIIVIGIVVSIVLHAVARHCILAYYAPGFGADTGFGSPAGLGGGYVDQKWRPHLGHTQNWSGVQGIPGPGSRSSISVPQR